MRKFLLPLFAALLAFAQPDPAVLLHQTFETSTGGWMALGQGNGIKPAPSGALEFDYELAPKHLAAMAMPAPAGLAQAAVFRFAVKADHSTAMAMLLSEKKPGGGNYAAWFWAPTGEWQTVELRPADFRVTDGEGDPVDADGKLDLDVVESIGILDLSQFFGTLKAEAPIPVRIDEASGKHKVLMKDFEMLSGPAGQGSALARGFLDWVSPGGMELKLSPTGNPLGVRALEAAYDHRDGQLDLLLRREGGMRPASLLKPTRIVFDIASERETTLVLALETKKPGGGAGPRYTMQIYPPGGREVFHVDLKLADFDGPGKFDPDQWRTTAILDVTNADGANRLWISDVHTAP
jgi:hypothetical protein